MSYILKALEKADRERSAEKEAEASGIDSVRLPVAKRGAGRRRFPVVIAGLVTLVAVGVAWWSVGRRGSPPPRKERTRRVQTVIPRAAVPGSAVPTAAEGDGRHARPAPAQPGHRKPHLAPPPRRPLRVKTVPSRLPGVGGKGAGEAPRDNKGRASVAPLRPVKPPDFEGNKQAAAEIKKRFAAVSATPKRPKGVKDWRDLPVDVRKALPNLRFSMLIYSDVPGDRMLSINGSVMHEGETVAPGLVLEQILPQGAIFKYQHYRFYKGVF